MDETAYSQRNLVEAHLVPPTRYDKLVAHFAAAVALAVAAHRAPSQLLAKINQIKRCDLC